MKLGRQLQLLFCSPSAIEAGAFFLMDQDSSLLGEGLEWGGVSCSLYCGSSRKLSTQPSSCKQPLEVIFQSQLGRVDALDIAGTEHVHVVQWSSKAFL